MCIRCSSAKWVSAYLKEPTMTDLIEYTEEYKVALVMGIKKFHPLYRDDMTEYPTTADKAEAILIPLRKEIKESYVSESKDPLALLDKAVEEKDVAMIKKIASEVWRGMPESRDIRNHPSFFVVCDICDSQWDGQI